MVVYEVNLSVQNEVAQDFSLWLEEHIKELLQLDGFESAHWFIREVDPIEEDSKDVLWTIHYIVKDRQFLQNYFDHHAQRFRQDGLDRFEGKFSAKRRVLILRKG